MTRTVKPHILQVAAKAIIMDPQGRILIVREAPTGTNNTQIGNWGLVGGRMEPGETFFDALQREVLEETGLMVRYVKPIDISEWHPIIRGTPHHIVAMFVLCDVMSDQRSVTLSDEHDAY